MLVMVDCFSRWTEACPLPDKTAISVADAFFSNVVCRFGMPTVIHSDQGREFENKVMHELCILGGAHKTKTTPYHPESDGLVERFNRTLLMMLAMFAGEHKDDWDDLLPPELDWNKRSPGLIPFVSCRPGAYGRLLLAVYERHLTGLLVSSDWLWPVMRGGWHCRSGPQTRFG